MGFLVDAGHCRSGRSFEFFKFGFIFLKEFAKSGPKHVGFVVTNHALVVLVVEFRRGHVVTLFQFVQIAFYVLVGPLQLMNLKGDQIFCELFLVEGLS